MAYDDKMLREIFGQDEEERKRLLAERAARKRKTLIDKVCKYGFTLSLATLFVDNTEGKCECCGKEPNNTDLIPDHNHTSGHFRGLICQACNIGIGNLGDSVEGVEKALNYLRKYGDGRQC